MQKHRFVQYLILSVIFIISALSAQPEHWLRLYGENNIVELKRLLNENKITDPDWAAFVKILFEEEVENALPQFVDLYRRSRDEKLRKIILDRISQYYYARGFYTTANRILKDADFRNQILSTKVSQKYYGVQLGAFSSYNNALKSKKKYLSKIKNVSIITKQRDNRKLYVVVAGKLGTKEEAVKLKTRIRNEFGQKGIIIQY